MVPRSAPGRGWGSAAPERTTAGPQPLAGGGRSFSYEHQRQPLRAPYFTGKYRDGINMKYQLSAVDYMIIY